jgi:glutamate dehydrogenase (NADP+)
MSQNSSRVQWTAEEVDVRLQEVMKDIYQKSIKAAQDYGIGNSE